MRLEGQDLDQERHHGWAVDLDGGGCAVDIGSVGVPAGWGGQWGRGRGRGRGGGGKG